MPAYRLEVAKSNRAGCTGESARRVKGLSETNAIQESNLAPRARLKRALYDSEHGLKSEGMDLSNGDIGDVSLSNP